MASTIASNVGLVSGLNIGDIVSALLTSQKNAVGKLTARENTFKATKAAIGTLSAKLIALSTSASSFSTKQIFDNFTSTSSDTSQLTAVASNTVEPGAYQFQVIRKATSQQSLSRGFANSTAQTVGTGTLSIARGGKLGSETSLDALNSGTGVRRGVVRVTDRSGAFADVDLTSALTLNDVTQAINNAAGISVTARVQGDKLILGDDTGLTTSNLTVTDRSGHAAADLGILQSVATDTLNGSSIYNVVGAFSLAKLNDGNGLRFLSDKNELEIGLTDVAETKIQVDLDGAASLSDVVGKINSATGNSGKVTASIADGKLVLTDNTGGGGANPLTVTSLNGSNAADVLGLGGTAVGNILTSKQLAAGLNSVLLRNLRGGQGIDQVGQISLTDRAGTTATIDLTGVESLDGVLAAINSATDGVTKLGLTAKLNTAGNGIEITDGTGQTASNLKIADVGGSTLAAQLGIAVDAGQTKVSSGNLNLRHVNQATSLSTYAPGGAAVRTGSIAIKDSTGVEHTVVIGSDLKTVGDIIDTFNSSTDGKVSAKLNETGDGFVLVDEAGGAGQLSVRELGSTTAADLRLTGTGTTALDGKSHLSSRLTTVITLDGSETLQGLNDKINAAKAGVTASIFSDGSAFTPKRLSITSKSSGVAGQVIIDDGGLGLGLDARVAGQDALLRVGDDPQTAFLVNSSTNIFDNVASGLTISAKTVGTSPATLTVARDPARVSSAISTFIKGYNDIISQVATLTKFDTATNTKGALQADGTATRLASALGELVNGTRFSTTQGDIQTVSGLGISFNADGTLGFDQAKFETVASANPTGVRDFFLKETTGFAAKLKATIDSYTDPVKGKLVAADKSSQDSVDAIERQITNLNAILDARQTNLLRQFYNMESILGSLQSQQSALAKITNLYDTSSS